MDRSPKRVVSASNSVSLPPDGYCSMTDRTAHSDAPFAVRTGQQGQPVGSTVTPVPKHPAAGEDPV